MLRTRHHITTTDTSGRLPLACDEDVARATALRYAPESETDPEYEPTVEQEKAITKALDALVEHGDTSGVVVPEGASYIIVRPLTDDELSRTQGDLPFNAQFGAIALTRIREKVKARRLKPADRELAQAEMLADMPERQQLAVRAFLKHQAEISERKAKLALVEIDGRSGEDAWAAVMDIEPALRRQVIAEIAGHAERITRPPAGGKA